MDDRELLELAAKAAGYEIEWVRNSGCHYRCEEEIGREQWCPLDDDGDALRLAVKLRIYIEFLPDAVRCIAPGGCWIGEVCLPCDTEHLGLAERRAIVRAAAEIGRSIQDAPQDPAG